MRRQAAWRPRCNRGGVVKTVGGTVHSAAELWLRVTWALYAGFKLGRQAAWRPRCNRGGVVKTIGGTVHSAAEL